jgi:hypothetical protein
MACCLDDIGLSFVMVGRAASVVNTASVRSVARGQRSRERMRHCS